MESLSLRIEKCGSERLSGWGKWLAWGVALVWCALHLNPFFYGQLLRELDLFCALALVFCFMDPKKQQLVRHATLWDGGLLLVLGGLFIWFLWLHPPFEGNGEPWVAPALLLVLLMEGARRAVGVALPAIFILVFFYALQHQSLKEVLDALVHSPDQGIWGISLRIATETLFMFVLLGGVWEWGEVGRELGRRWTVWARKRQLTQGSYLSGLTVLSGLGSVTGPSGLALTGGLAAEIATPATLLIFYSLMQLIPPILGPAGFIVADYCGVSYQYVVLYLLPLTLVIFMILTLLYRQKTLPQANEDRSSLFPFLLSIIFLIGLMVIGQAERAALVALILFIVTGGLGRGFFRAFILGARRMMVITVGVAMTGCIVILLSLEVTPFFVPFVVETIPRLLFPFLTLVLILLLSAFLPVLPTYMISANLAVPALIALKFPLLESHLFCFSLAAIGDALPFSSFTKRTLDHITGKQPVKYSELKPLVLLFLLPFIFLTIQNIS